jgi:hypothetical protein
MNGGKFTGRRYGPFQTTSGPIHISPEFDNKSKRPSPASYNVAKTLGKDAPSASFKGSRPNSLFGGNVAVYNVFAFGTWFVQYKQCIIKQIFLTHYLIHIYHTFFNASS